MSEEKTGLVDATGKSIKKISVPTIKIGKFMFAFHTVEEGERARIVAEGNASGVRPGDIIKELRATQREMNHRFTILSAALAKASEENKTLKKFLNQIGLTVDDIHGNSFFRCDGAPEKKEEKPKA